MRRNGEEVYWKCAMCSAHCAPRASQTLLFKGTAVQINAVQSEWMHCGGIYAETMRSSVLKFAYLLEWDIHVQKVYCLFGLKGRGGLVGGHS